MRLKNKLFGSDCTYVTVGFDQRNSGGGKIKEEVVSVIETSTKSNRTRKATTIYHLIA